MKKRFSWIDIARGIGIIAVLYGHAISGDSYRHLLYAFHMPLFFFLSGVVFYPKKNPNFLPFLKKNFLTILLPYFLFSTLSYLIWILGRDELPTIPQISQHVVNILYGNSSGLFFNVVLWFLPCLFMTRLFFWSITKISLNVKFLSTILILLSIVAYIFSLIYPGIKLPFGTETAMTATVFFGIGYVWQTYAQPVMRYVRSHAILLTILLISILIVLASINYDLFGYQIDMRLNRYSNYFLFYGAALSGILATTVISLKVDKSPVLEYIGKQSLPLFVWHIIIFTYLTQFTRLFVSPETFSILRNLIIAPLFTIGTIGIILGGLRIYQFTMHRLFSQNRSH